MNKLSFFNIFSIAFGGIIGWGAFVLPGSLFLQKASLASIIVGFTFSTIAILFISASYCINFKLSSDSGGEISSTNFSLGKRHGFFCGWMIILVYISIVTLNVSALPTVLRQINPDIFTKGYAYSVAGWDVYISDIIICSIAIMFFAFINTRAARLVGRFQNRVTTILLLVVTILGSSVYFSGKTVPISLFTADISNYDGVYSIFAIAPWAYIGFNIIPQIKGDTSINSRKAYILMALSVLCGTLVYLLLTVVTIAGTDILTVGMDEPWVTGWAVQQLLGVTGLYLIFAGIVTAVLAGINAFLYGSARLLYVMSNLDMLPVWFSRTKNGIPVHAVIFVTLVTLVAPFFGRTVLTWVVDMSSVGAAIGFLYTGLSGLKATPKKNSLSIITHSFTCIISLLFLVLLLNPYISSRAKT